MVELVGCQGLVTVIIFKDECVLPTRNLDLRGDLDACNVRGKDTRPVRSIQRVDEADPILELIAVVDVVFITNECIEANPLD